MNQTLDATVQLSTYKDYINDAIGTALSSLSHPQIKAAATHIFSGGGKRIRPCLLLAAYEAAGGEKIEEAIDIAVAIELIHNWSLIHDDIIDKSELRRGLPTVHKKWNVDLAILAGDAINNLAYNLITNAPIGSGKKVEIIRCLSQSVQRLIDGELEDILFENRDSVSEAEYMAMIDKKTGALFSCSMKIGALLASDDQSIIGAFESYGEKIGLAFQVQDDLLDLTGQTSKIGKEVGQDIREGKKTMMVVHALVNAVEDQKERLKHILTSNESDASVIKEAIDILSNVGSIFYAKDFIDRLINQSIEDLSVVDFSEAQQLLVGLATFVASRNY